ncbi:MAG: polysaccharide deacetylase family protein, partial [Thermodesulfobacteriota bacterium]
MSLRAFFYACSVVFLLIALACPACLQAAAGEAGESQQGPAQIRAFIYHHFGMQDEYPSTSVSVQQFQGHLEYLQGNDYTVLTFGEALERLYAEKNLPERTAVITIDDGYLSVWDKALPLLEKYGFPATIFISTSHVGGSNYLSWEQVKKLEEKGFEIGNHSHSHAYFLNESKEDIAKEFEADLETSHKEFRRHLGSVPELYAYPFGEYVPEMMSILEKHGYSAAAAQHSGVIYKGSRRFALPRFPMNLNYAEMESFEEKIRMNALQVVEADPANPLALEDDPPRLKLRIENQEVDAQGLQCFVSGQRDCSVEKTAKNGTLEVEVQAES